MSRSTWRERALAVEPGAKLGPAIGLRRRAAGGALGGDDRLEAAVLIFDPPGKRAGGNALALRPGQSGGEFGEPGLVVLGAEDELHDRRHRRARLRLDPGIGEQFGIIVRRLGGGEREIIGVAERAVQSVAAALVGARGLLGAEARGAEPVGEAGRRRARGSGSNRRAAPRAAGALSAKSAFGPSAQTRASAPNGAGGGGAARAASTWLTSAEAVSASAISFQLITP